MCGITGFISKSDAYDREAVINDMMQCIYSRGPDEAGFYCDEMACLGMRRLSIIGLDNGKQPIENEDHTLVLVYNGEIYNFPALKKELTEKGHIFTTDTDSEVILHGYEEYGPDLLNRLRGMFAFSIWNKEKKTMFLARDMFGIKPLFYGKKGRDLFYASEIKAIFAHPDMEKRFNEAALGNYLSFQYNAMEETFFKGVYQLLPGHYMYWKDGEITVRCYWKPRFHIQEDLTEAEAMSRLKAALEDSVEAHKISDVEMASFLSGGIDSSFLTAASGFKKSFSVGFEWDEWNEVNLAKELSAELGIENHDKIITTEEYWDAVPKVQKYLDEPVADPSIIPLYYLCQLASGHVKVVVSGEGSDELFGGYTIYHTPLSLRPVRIIPRGIRRLISKIFLKCPFDFKGKQYMIRAGQDIEERFIGNAYIFYPSQVRRLLKKSRGYVTPQQLTRPYYEEVSDLDDVTKMQYIDLSFWLRGDILRKSDHMSMAHSLEVRVPFLDMEVAKVALSLPPEMRVTDENTKILFRKVSRGYLPEKNAKRKKLGFPVPIAKWLKEDTYYQKVYKAFTSNAAERYFNTSELLRLLKVHKSGKKNYSRKIWTVYMFLLWYEMNFGGTS